jgi:3',5'-cyclic AMP phosphodiesterase CpdA
MLLHLSDLHFGTEQPMVQAALKRLCARLHPEAVVVSGDVTQRARVEQFVAAHGFLQSLNRPLLVVAGNHDIPLFHVSRRLFMPYHHFCQTFGALEPTLETAHFYLVGVNSITRHHHTQGSLSPLQIWHTADRLKQAPAGKHRLVVSHQPFAVKQAVEAEDIPRRMPQAAQHWAQAGLDMLLHGHFHAPAVFDLNATLQLGQSRPVLDVQAGTALSSRLRQGIPNSVNLIHPDLGVERLDFSHDQGGFRHASWLWPSAAMAQP